jgi:hypothetical protein
MLVHTVNFEAESAKTSSKTETFGFIAGSKTLKSTYSEGYPNVKCMVGNKTYNIRPDNIIKHSFTVLKYIL